MPPTKSPKWQDDMDDMPVPANGGAGVFPVTVEAIVSFVQSPTDAFAAIVRYAKDNVFITTEASEQLNEGVKFSFVYDGIRHDVTLTHAEEGPR